MKGYIKLLLVLVVMVSAHTAAFAQQNVLNAKTPDQMRALNWRVLYCQRNPCLTVM